MVLSNLSLGWLYSLKAIRKMEYHCTFSLVNEWVWLTRQTYSTCALRDREEKVWWESKLSFLLHTTDKVTSHHLWRSYFYCTTCTSALKIYSLQAYCFHAILATFIFWEKVCYLEVKARSKIWKLSFSLTGICSFRVTLGLLQGKWIYRHICPWKTDDILKFFLCFVHCSCLFI